MQSFLRPVLYLNGLFLVVLAATMIIPIATEMALADGRPWLFLLPMQITMFFGITLVLGFRGDQLTLNVRQAFLLTSTVWASAALAGALPLMTDAGGLGFTDAYFEAMSALTTTGSTVMTNLDETEHGILLWRSLLQWIGGVGIILMGIAILPFIGVAGMQLFRTESSEKSGKVLPKLASFARAIGLIYVILTMACGLAYYGAGMSAFDAVNHAMTTLSTGGFSTHDASMAYFSNPTIEWIAIAFMIVGALPFVLYIRLLTGSPLALARDVQVQWFLGISLATVAVMTVWQIEENGILVPLALRSSAFNIVSVITTTGFGSSDYAHWGPFANVSFLFLVFMGGCTGSTAGGVKAFHFLVVLTALKSHAKRLVHPNGVFIPTYNRTPLPDNVIRSVLGFLLLYVMVFMFVSMALGFLGLDMVTALSGAATSLANVGPGLGDVIGPAGSFQSMPDAAKWLLSFTMLTGRLELFTVLLLLTPWFWRA